MSNRGRYIAYAKKMQELTGKYNPESRPSAIGRLEAQQQKIRRQAEIEEALKEAMTDGK